MIEPYANTPTTPPTAYQILGLNPTCSDTAIPAAYHRITRDILSTDYTNTGQGQYLLAFIDYHYSLINSPAKRFAYDHVLKNDPTELRQHLTSLKQLEGKYERLLFRHNKLRQSYKKEYGRVSIQVPVLAGMVEGAVSGFLKAVALAVVVILLLILF